MDPRAQFTNLRTRTKNLRARLINCVWRFVTPEPTHLHVALSFYPRAPKGGAPYFCTCQFLWWVICVELFG